MNSYLLMFIRWGTWKTLIFGGNIKPFPEQFMIFKTQFVMSILQWSCNIINYHCSYFSALENKFHWPYWNMHSSSDLVSRNGFRQISATGGALVPTFLPAMHYHVLIFIGWVARPVGWESPARPVPHRRCFSLARFALACSCSARRAAGPVEVSNTQGGVQLLLLRFFFLFFLTSPSCHSRPLNVIFPWYFIF